MVVPNSFLDEAERMGSADQLEAVPFLDVQRLRPTLPSEDVCNLLPQILALAIITSMDTRRAIARSRMPSSLPDDRRRRGERW